MRAWHALETCRDVGMAAGPIPWTAIDTYCERQGFDADAAMLLHHVIAYVDGERAQADAAARSLKTARGG